MNEPIDLEEARDEDPEAVRDALLDQVSHLVDEIEALQTVIDGLPDDIKTGRPAPDALTMMEIYGAITTLDEEVRQPRIERIVDEDDPTLSPVNIEADVREGGWNDREFGDVLDRLKDARRRLVDRLDALPLDAWHRTATLEDETLRLFELVHRMTREDLQRLRDLGYRLHGAHLSDRDEPLPT